MKISYELQAETTLALNQVPARTVSGQFTQIGVRHGEPLLVAMDAMLRYAKAYAQEQGQPVGEDYVLGPEFHSAIDGIRGLLNGNGAVAMEMGRNTDSKDNSALESIYWTAREFAGMPEGWKDLD